MAETYSVSLEKLIEQFSHFLIEHHIHSFCCFSRTSSATKCRINSWQRPQPFPHRVTALTSSYVDAPAATAVAISP